MEIPRYELTVTLKPIHYKLTPYEQHYLATCAFNRMKMNQRSSGIAELTQTQNVHYHFIVEISNLEDKKDFCNLLRKENKIFGRTELKLVKWETSYIEYMRKDITTTRYVLGVDPVVCDKFGIFCEGLKGFDVDSQKASPARGGSLRSPGQEAKKKGNYKDVLLSGSSADREEELNSILKDSIQKKQL